MTAAPVERGERRARARRTYRRRGSWQPGPGARSGRRGRSASASRARSGAVLAQFCKQTQSNKRGVNFDLCNAYMTVYTTMPGGDAGHTQAAASPPEGRGRNRPAANLQQSRRQGAVPSESPTSAVPGEQGLRPWQPSQPMRARRKPRTAAELRRAASSRPVHESAVLCLHGSQSHRWHVVGRTRHHPRHHQ